MKTKLFTPLGSRAHSVVLCILCTLFLSLNAWADPVAIGTGTVTLNKDNTSNPSPITNTHTMVSLANEECIMYSDNGGNVQFYQVDWAVTITPGIYDIDLSYGTWSYGFTPTFAIIDPDNGNTVKSIHTPGWQSSNAWNTEANLSTTKTDQDLNDLTPGKTYYVRASMTGGYGLCVGHISFTRTDNCTEYTATFNASGTEASGAAPAAISKCADIAFTMPNQGSLLKPGYLLAGWNDGSNTYAAGAFYTMPNHDVAFTAQWEEDNTSLHIPATSMLNYANKTGGSSDTRDFYDETCVDLYTTHYVEWNAYITPGNYQISMKYGSPYWGIRGTFSIIDPLGIEPTRVFYTQVDETNGADPIYRNPSVTYDLTGLTADKLYTIKVEHNWGGSSLSIAHIEFTPLGGDHNITFAKGNDNVTGSIPASTVAAEGGEYTLPGKGDLALMGYAFAGWNDGSNTYAAGDAYTMPNQDVTFTAQWTPFTLPTVTNAAGSAENEVVTITYSIPGICDLSNPVAATKSADASNLSSAVYNDADNYVTAIGTAPKWEQYGVAFNIPTTTNIEWLSYEYQGYHDDVAIWGGLCDASYAYWSGDAPGLDDNTNWISSGVQTPIYSYWHESMGGTLASKSISQVAIYANAGNATYQDVTFLIKNVRYHIANQEDIDHVVIMRKSGQDQLSSGLADGTLLEPETRSKFVDSESKAEGWYSYTIFAVHADGTLSAGVTVNVLVEAAPTYTITYAAGGDDVTGTVPTEGDHVAGAQFTIAGKGDLARPGYTFAGWNDGTNDYATGDTYTMPDENVTITAQWAPFVVPTVTNLAIDPSAESGNVPLSWNIPGKIDLSNWSLSNSDPDYFIVYQKPVADGNVSYDAETEELAITHSSPAWDQYGVALPIELTNLESITYGYKGHNVFLAVVKQNEDVLYWQSEGVASSGDWTSFACTPTTIYPSAGTVSSIPATRAITFCSNPDHAASDETFYISNVFYHCTGQIDIDHIVLVRKAGAEPANATDGDILHSGTLSHFIDTEAKTPGTTYYYTIFSIHADGASSIGVTATYTEPEKPVYERTGLTVGEYGTVCWPYAVEAADRSGAEIYEVEAWSADGKLLTLTQLGDNEDMVAGRPYIFKATDNTLTLRYSDNVAQAAVADPDDCNGLTGSYVQAEITQNDNNYIIYNNQLYLVTVLAYVGANRAYIHKQNLTQPAPVGRRRITLGVNGTQTATDIDNVTGNPSSVTLKYIENGHLFIIRDGKTYNAQGQVIK